MGQALREQLLERFLAWARRRGSVRAVALTGSGARSERPADVWSDLDLVVLTSNPRTFFTSDRWLEALGKPWAAIVERTAAGRPFERRVLFEGGVDVDFIILRAQSLRGALPRTPRGEIRRRGVRVLQDKDGLLGSLPEPPSEPSQPPTAEAFLAVVHDFWYHAAWTAKKLRRGELWTAKSCCDTYMKGLLLRMVEWQARAGRGWALDTWYGGRFLEQWAAPQVVAELQRCFAHYDEEDVWRALAATMDLFRRLATEVAGCLGYDYPAGSGQDIAAWVAECRAQG